jgi:hypothetical protein
MTDTPTIRVRLELCELLSFVGSPTRQSDLLSGSGKGGAVSI